MYCHPPNDKHSFPFPIPARAYSVLGQERHPFTGKCRDMQNCPSLTTGEVGKVGIKMGEKEILEEKVTHQSGWSKMQLEVRILLLI